MKNKYKKLFIIGNGFDRWQGLPTSYDHFKDYYRKNIREIVKDLSIKATTDHDGNLITPVEMIFGNISKPGSLSEEFFWNYGIYNSVIMGQRGVRLGSYQYGCSRPGVGVGNL